MPVALVHGGTITRSDAVFNTARTHRLVLWRSWSSRPMCAFIGLNPSTADEHDPDNTITRCIGFAARWGFGGFYMLNLFSFCATKPKVMYAASDPVGQLNNAFLEFYARSQAKVVIAAWGMLPNQIARLREQAVLRLLRDVKLHCMGTTIGGYPRHPLYLPNESSYTEFKK
jgi:hypothetical protein